MALGLTSNSRMDGTRWIWTVILPVLTCVNSIRSDKMWTPPRMQRFMYDLPAGTEHCFFEPVPRGFNLAVTFKVSLSKCKLGAIFKLWIYAFDWRGNDNAHLLWPSQWPACNAAALDVDAILVYRWCCNLITSWWSKGLVPREGDVAGVKISVAVSYCSGIVRQLCDHRMLSYFQSATIPQCLCDDSMMTSDGRLMVVWQWCCRCWLHLILYLTDLIAWKIPIIVQKFWENHAKIMPRLSVITYWRPQILSIVQVSFNILWCHTSIAQWCSILWWCLSNSHV